MTLLTCHSGSSGGDTTLLIVDFLVEHCSYRLKNIFRIFLSSVGLTSTLVFNNAATKVLNLLKVPEDYQEETSIENLSKRIVSEVKEIKFDCSHYDIRITEEDMST